MSDTPTIPLPDFKIKDKVTVADPNSPHAGEVGIVISTATTVEKSAVSVKFKPDQQSVWFYSRQLTRTQ